MDNVETVKTKEKYEECNACGSTDEVFILKVGRENKICLKLCNGCRGDVINQFKEVTEAF